MGNENSKFLDEIEKDTKKQLIRNIFDMQIDKKIVDTVTAANFGSILKDPILEVGTAVVFCSLLKDGLNLMKQYIIYAWNELNLDNPYHKCEEYKKLKTLYNEYVQKIAAYFKEIGLNDPILIADYFNTLVKHGGISKYNEFEFKNTSDANLIKNNILGANIVLGEGCCRHLSVLLSDIYKEMGFESKCLIVKSYRTNFSNSLLRFLKYLNHAVVLVKTYKGNIIVDPTNNVFGNINDKKTGTKNLITLNGEKKRYKLDFSCSFDGKYILNIEDDKLMKENNRLLTQDEIKAATKLTDQVKQRVPLYKFKEKNNELIKELNDAVVKIKS